MSQVNKDWALYYASLGWAVFPLHPKTKQPANKHGSAEATSDPVRIAEWWDWLPTANIGMCPAKSGLYALDVDPRNGGDKSFEQLQVEHSGALASPLMNMSGSGSGFHQLFRAKPDAKYMGQPAPGIDGKHKGFIVLPPSLHPSGKLYEWSGGTYPTPDLINSLDVAPAFLEKPIIERRETAIIGSHHDVPLIRSALEHVDPDSYEDWYQTIASLKHWGDHAELEPTAFELGLEWSARSPKHDPGQFEEKWDSFDSFKKDARKMGSLIAQARANGFQPGPDPAEVFAQAVAAPVPTVSGVAPAPIPPPDLDAFPTDSDQYQGRWFAGKASQYFRYTEGLGWLSFDGARWVADGARSARLALGNQLQGMLASVAPSKQTAFVSNGRLHGILEVAKDFPQINIKADQWDADPFLINTPVAAYDLRTGQPVDRATLNFTQVTAVSPDFNMPTPIWDKVIRMICPEHEFLMRALGYGLSGSMREELIFVAYGSGSNGKSKLFECVRGILGDYATGFSSNALIRSRNAEDTKELAKLRGKRFALAEEIRAGTTWDEEKVKNLTSASALTVKLMRENAFEVVAQQKVFVTTNYTPVLDGTDYAMSRRIALISFPRRLEDHEKDVDLPNKLRAEWPGILAKLILAGRDWATQGIQLPDSVKRGVADYMAEHDEIQLWVDERCVVADDARAERGTLYTSFTLHMRESGRHPPSRRAFYGQLAAKNYKPLNSNGERYFLGINLRNALNSPS